MFVSKLALITLDAAAMAIAEELGLGRMATLDRRRFGAVQAQVGLKLLP